VSRLFRSGRRISWPVCLLAANAWLAAAILLGCADDKPAELTPEFVLQRAEEALFDGEGLPRIIETAVSVEGETETPWFASEAVFSGDPDAARIAVTKPRELTLDIPDRVDVLAVDGFTYLKSGDDAVQQLPGEEGGLERCVREATTFMRQWLLCGLNLYSVGGLEGTLTVTERVTFRDRPAVSLNWSAANPSDPTATFTTTVFLAADTYLPVGYIRDFDGGSMGQTAQLRGVWEVERMTEAGSDYFEPGAFGYVQPEDRLVHELDTASEPLYWLGHEVDVAGQAALKLSWAYVTTPPLPGAERGAWASLEYSSLSESNALHLELWRPGDWESFLVLLAGYDSAFREGCFVSSRAAGPNDVEIISFVYGERLPPSDSPRTPTSACPAGEPDWTMAVVRFADGTVTFNAPIGLNGARPGAEYGSERHLLEFAGLLRLRQKGE
jgi:hypothetical protein